MNLGIPIQRDDGWIYLAHYSKSGSKAMGQFRIHVRNGTATYVTAIELIEEAVETVSAERMA